MKLHIVMHESFEAPAAIELWAKKNNHEISYSCTYQGDKLPESSSGFDFLIVMGGPQCPATTKEECPHFDALGEVALIKKAIDSGKYVFGVCLGAQLIGEALGARFDNSPNREIGFFEITLTESGKKDSIFSEFPEKFTVGHWHGDMPGLTSSSEILAFSAGCPKQVVKYTPKVYGFQCHFEFTPETIEGMIKNNAKELEDYKNLPYIQTVDQLRKGDCQTMNDLLFIFLDKLTHS